ncbi:UNVERIFIED_CONTAM: hypothetical protein Slati_1401800 [Sesamum latifolium]|uniref:Uncharacterized protein n=1 Tax=Sesamum latifolium TaxID=2727402 RepID=A0AAW2X5B2_9LAMI
MLFDKDWRMTNNQSIWLLVTHSNIKKMVDTPTNHSVEHGKQVVIWPSGVQVETQPEAEEMITISRNDLRWMFEEWATERAMIPSPLLSLIPQLELEKHEASIEPYVLEPVSYPKVRRRLFSIRDEEELLPAPPHRPRTHERARRAPSKEVNSRRNTITEGQMRRDEQI